ncbi:hypothetical protein BFP70_09930 [Thioclava sp. SK-1]|uniref:sll0787 family AIR synthase-like protein n=1 Tax=Thioclava sp. SK-1 TaxID=1889770 RepID=UPI000825D813|nr:sll0787 family AIR synthase-like protein [Thioclava sp. SK-1]OCX65372.1 hypothetical protein BFP70_09930 [Thioclava sp. SK-1]
MIVTPVKTPLDSLAEALRCHPSIRSKLAIGAAGRALGLTAASYGHPGDDAAALPNGGGYDLIAGEGFIPAFIKDDPWFAGWCAVMVNLSDIAAMGGRARAIVDQIWAPTPGQAEPMLAGMKAAATAYGVPLVGGHTNFAAPDLGLAATVLGRADVLISSFAARPGHVLVGVIDHRGAYRNFDNFFAAAHATSDQLRRDLELLPELAQSGLVPAGKDISQGGIAGTALMLAECSNVGIVLDLGAIHPPSGVSLPRWLRSFPSYGFLLSVAPESVAQLCAQFDAHGIAAQVFGHVTDGTAVTLRDGLDAAIFWDHAQSPYLNLGGLNA